MKGRCKGVGGGDGSLVGFPLGLCNTRGRGGEKGGGFFVWATPL